MTPQTIYIPSPQFAALSREHVRLLIASFDPARAFLAKRELAYVQGQLARAQVTNERRP